MNRYIVRLLPVDSAGCSCIYFVKIKVLTVLTEYLNTGFLLEGLSLCLCLSVCTYDNEKKKCSIWQRSWLTLIVKIYKSLKSNKLLL